MTTRVRSSKGKVVALLFFPGYGLHILVAVQKALHAVLL